MNTFVFVNRFLTLSAQNPYCGYYAAKGSMIPWLWKLLGNDVDAAPRKQRQREQDASRILQEHLIQDQQRKDKDDRYFTELLIVSEVSRRTFENLSCEIENAIRVARQSYARAVDAEEQARKSLEDTQGKAIVLPDGRRVYFDGNGHLYGEDLQEITKADAIDEARRQRLRDQIPSFEFYLDVRKRHDAADELVQQLSHILEELDGLKQLQATGVASTEEIECRRETLIRILETLPTGARADFDALQKARLVERIPDYVETGLTPPTDAEASKAASSFSNQVIEAEAEATAPDKPAYTNIPSF